MITPIDMVEWMFYTSEALAARVRVDTLRVAKALQVRNQ